MQVEVATARGAKMTKALQRNAIHDNSGISRTVDTADHHAGSRTYPSVDSGNSIGTTAAQAPRHPCCARTAT
ncbi:hypothetical protein DOTSEDRAFT_75230 [Dothistroma septosporum NZE10]|uniref:Uncharacterized protein n=1 Tax=Dothistroma septosporum (strain NZE10 / CBS 128990) TaxID=675120 RepID=M2YKU7_DOTSN|nr:hypothetical protein DOTSEDRAFT_75230 [Dothistroma septosporum NZE10]